MLCYTGHPLLDVGVATITAFVGKDDPTQVTTADMAEVAAYLERHYSHNPMKSFLTVIFPNSGFTQPAFDTQPAKRAAYAEYVLRAWHPDRPRLPEPCVFFGTPAVLRAYREMIPLIGSESGFNFYAEGAAGLPVSGEALLAIHAMPIGALKCAGRVLLFHAEHSPLTQDLAARALTINRGYLDLAAHQGGHTTKYHDAKHPTTQIVSMLLDAEQQRRDYAACSITAYHLTNYGTNADISMYHLPLQMTRFLYQATDAMYRAAWNRLVQRAWVGDDAVPTHDTLGLPARRNTLFEDLFDLPANAQRFLRTYLLRMPVVERTAKDDPRRTYSLVREVDYVSWPLTQLFLKEVMHVDERRIDALRTMADQLAEYIQREEDHRLLRLLLYGGNSGKDYQELRTRLIRADYAAARQTEPLFTLDQFLTVFEYTDERSWWMLARDLLLIRIIERLHDQKWFASNPNAIAPPTEMDETATP
ncbi:MAG: hypothetical protein HC914_15360 [Chloroflexaceae bacterium]|nr:hypothetical protein [Chloroflexaceae bacterium]